MHESPSSEGRARVITPWSQYLIEDRRSLDRFTIVWEMATVQWGLPLSVLSAGLALELVGAARTHLAGCLLFALGIRPRRDVG